MFDKHQPVHRQNILRLNFQGQNVLGKKHPEGQNILQTKHPVRQNVQKGQMSLGQNVLETNVQRDKTSFCNIYKTNMFYVILYLYQ